MTTSSGTHRTGNVFLVNLLKRSSEGRVELGVPELLLGGLVRLGSSCARRRDKVALGKAGAARGSISQFWWSIFSPFEGYSSIFLSFIATVIRAFCRPMLFMVLGSTIFWHLVCDCRADYFSRNVWRVYIWSFRRIFIHHLTYDELWTYCSLSCWGGAVGVAHGVIAVGSPWPWFPSNLDASRSRPAKGRIQTWHTHSQAKRECQRSVCSPSSWHL